MKKTTLFSPETRERAVRMVNEHRADYKSEWAVLLSIAPKIGCTPETLRQWLRQYERNTISRACQSPSEAERIKTLEREVRELKKANEILRLASAFFAQAELDRRLKS
jgi:transposase